MCLPMRVTSLMCVNESLSDELKRQGDLKFLLILRERGREGGRGGREGGKERGTIMIAIGV